MSRRHDAADDGPHRRLSLDHHHHVTRESVLSCTARTPNSLLLQWAGIVWDEVLGTIWWHSMRVLIPQGNLWWPSTQ